MGNRAKPSAHLLNLKKIQSVLVKNKKYIEANNVYKQVQELESLE